MAFPDVGLAPPPPPDVMGQMKPSSPGGTPPPKGGAPDLGAILASLAGGAPQGPQVDITPKVMELDPMLTQIARQVPALGPDVDRLMVELKSRMGGLPAAFAGGMGPAITPASSGVAPVQTPPGVAAAGVTTPVPPAAPPTPALPPPMPVNPAAEMGAMDTAMQLEIKLPELGKDDPTLMPYIQGFVARMREEVPRVVSGETEAVKPPPESTPTDVMLTKIPVNY